MKELLKQLCTLDGIGGYEDEVREGIMKLAAPYADEMLTDAIGNLLVFKKGKSRRSSPLALCAHMDEVGLMVRTITENGMLKLAFVGSIDPRVLIGRKMKVGLKKIPGVISLKAIHLTTPEERKVAPPLGSLYIDIGATSRKEAEKYVSVGDPCYFDSPFKEIGPENVCSKAIDDRVGCAVMLKLMQEELPFDTWFVFSTNEEIGGTRGALIAAQRLNPSFIGILEGTTAADMPDVEDRSHSTTQRQGCVVSIMDKGTIYHRDTHRRMTALATEAGIKWQYRRSANGSTDAAGMHKAHAGAKAFGMAIPTRYIHCACNMAYLPDIEEMLKMARLFVKECGDNA